MAGGVNLEFKLETDFEATVKKLQSTPREIKKASREGLVAIVEAIETRAQFTSLKTKKSGRMFRSIKVSELSTPRKGLLKISVRPTKFYGIMVEGGTTKKPKTGKYAHVEGGPYIHIPLLNNLTNGGWPPKISATEAFKSHGAFIWHVRGKHFIALPTTPPRALFVLVKEAKTKARPFMQPAFNTVKGFAGKLMDNVMKRALRRAFTSRRSVKKAA